MSEKSVMTKAELETVLAGVVFLPSCVNFAWQWDVKEVFEQVRDVDICTYRLTGWLVRTTFARPDIETWIVGRGYGRWEFMSVGTSESGVVKTCWLLAELIVRHELMEAFTYKEAKLFDPHHTVAQLAAAGRSPR